MVLLKDRTTVWVLNWKTGQPIEFRSIAENGGGSDMSRVPHGEPYAGKLHVRFDEGYPPKNGEVRFEGSRRPSGRSPRGVPLYSTPILDPSSSLKRFSSVALVTRRIVIIGRFVPSRPQWNECRCPRSTEPDNTGRVIAANTTENEGELNHQASSSKPAIVRSFEGLFFGILSPRKRMIDEQ